MHTYTASVSGDSLRSERTVDGSTRTKSPGPSESSSSPSVNAIMARLKRSDEEPDAPTAEVAVLSEIRDLLATQRAPGA